jgi:hypothetical protein
MDRPRTDWIVDPQFVQQDDTDDDNNARDGSDDDR